MKMRVVLLALLLAPTLAGCGEMLVSIFTGQTAESCAAMGEVLVLSSTGASCG